MTPTTRAVWRTGLTAWVAASLLAPAHSFVQPDRTSEVYAIRYATLPKFPVSSLVAGADASRAIDLAMMVWLIHGAGDRRILVDAGFYREKFIQRWKPTGFVRPSEAVAGLGPAPADITDIILTHVHWDHADGIDLFPSARVWIQADEYHYYVGDAGEVRNRGIDAETAASLAGLRRAGRVRLVEGDAPDIVPGVTLHAGGRHTYASQFVSVQTAAGTVVIASDNLYLYENLDKRVAIAQTFDTDANLRAQDRMRSIASAPRLIVPGHDPAVFARFPLVRPGIVRIQ